MRIEPRSLRKCLGHFATGVTVVTRRAAGNVHGLTVNAFTAVSLAPPLVMVSLDRRTRACGDLAGSPFTVNLLSDEQRDVAMHFAGRPQDVSIRWEAGQAAPRIGGCIAYIECAPWCSYDGGDHVLYLGEVVDFEVRTGDPLIFYAGAFHRAGETLEGVPWIDSLDCPSGSGWFGPQHPLPIPGYAR